MMAREFFQILPHLKLQVRMAAGHSASGPLRCHPRGSSMNPHIEKLKERLAAGEISIEQYRKLVELVSDGVDGVRTGNAAKLGTAPIIEVENKKFGKLSLFHDHILTAQLKKQLSEITSIIYYGFRGTTNLIPTSRVTSLTFKFADGVSLLLEEKRTYTAFDVHKKLGKIYSYIATKTFKSRLDFLVNTIRTNGKIELYKGIFLYRNGFLSDGISTVDLKTASSYGSLEFGYNTYSSYSPNHVTASETKLKDAWFTFSRLPKGTIRFYLGLTDPDITRSLLLWLSKENNVL